MTAKRELSRGLYAHGATLTEFSRTQSCHKGDARTTIAEPCRRKFKTKAAPIDTQLSRPTFAWFRAGSNMGGVSVPITVPVANADAASYTRLRLTPASYLSGKLSGLMFQKKLSAGRSGRI